MRNKRSVRKILKANTMGGGGETNGYEDDEENRGLMYRSDESEEIKHQRNRELYEGNQKRSKPEHGENKKKTKTPFKMAKEM